MVTRRTVLGRSLRRALSGVRPRSVSSAQAAWETSSEEPLLSVVVPVFQVERYLAECVESLLAQTYRRLEIILVDDGSTDRSGRIAAELAERDARVRLVRQENRGLGAARNTGLDHATGELITFADSDDTVPDDAYRRMVRTLVRSGSDFVVGAYVRHQDGVERMPPWVKRAHARRRLAITIDQAPDLLSNVVACTKVFRRDFLDRVGLRFPVAIRYEDQVPMTRAYLEARAFDVIPAVVYRWRTRDDKSSITQGKAEIADLLDRVTVQRELAELVHEQASPRVLRHWYVKLLRSDFYLYLKVAAEADDDYWRLFRHHLTGTALKAPDGLDDEVEMRVRVALWLTRHGHQEALRRLVRSPGFASSDFPVVRQDDHLVLDLAFLDVAVPPEVRRVRAVDLTMSTRLLALDWSSPGQLAVRCVAAVRYLDPRHEDVDTTLWWLGPEDLQGPSCATVVAEDPAANLTARRSHEDHARSSRVGVVGLAALVEASGERPLTRWELHVTAQAHGLAVDTVVDSRREEGSAALVRSAVVSGAQVTVAWSERRGLVLEVRRGFAALTRATQTGGGVELEVVVGDPDSQPDSQPDSPPTLVVGGAAVGGEVTQRCPGTWVIRTDLTDSSGAAAAGRLRLVVAGGPSVEVANAGSLQPVALGDGRWVEVDVAGRVVAVHRRSVVWVDGVAAGAGHVRLSGRSAGLVDGQARLRGPRARTSWQPVETTPDGFEVRLPTQQEGWGATPSDLPPNNYTVEVRDEHGRVVVLAGVLVDDAEPPDTDGPWSLRVRSDRRLLLRRSRHDDRVTSSNWVQTCLRSTVYGPAVRGARRPAIVLECFSGTGAGDTPRAVSDRLGELRPDLHRVWSTADTSVAVPAGTRPVLRDTADWYDAVGSARLVLANNTLPRHVVKGRGQVFVQAWHGTPLKAIGTDIVRPRIAAEHYVRHLLREAATWDLLVSPSAYVTRIFRRALAYQGEILEIGRPGNDVLLHPRADQVRAAARARLGVDEDQTVLLYAPTWRDDAEREAPLDHAALTAARPDVTVLLRTHANMWRKPRVHGVDRVIDVTSYPDIAELYLAADVLVTDYSSAMFDFALTDKPIVLLAPDLEYYRDSVRGLYLDLHDMAPGPIVRTTGEVLDVLGGDDEFAMARKQLRGEFAPHDDGHATGRLLRVLLERLG